MLHTAVILGILSVKTVFKFAHAKLMVLGLELNQIVRVSGRDNNSVKPSPKGWVLKLGPRFQDDVGLHTIVQTYCHSSL